MKAIITQREAIDSHGVPIDVLESNYIYYFESLDLELLVISNFHKNIKEYLSKTDYDIVILTGGGSIPPDFYDEERNDFIQKNRDITEKIIIKEALKKNVPIVAICRGMQFINGMFGGKISKLRNLKVKRSIGISHPVIIGKDYMVKVNNYHNDGIYVDHLADEFKIVALDKENGVVEAFYSPNRRILGLQWHPEREFTDNKAEQLSRKLLKTFIEKRGLLDESYYISSRPRN